MVEFINKNVSVYFDDLAKVSMKRGKITEISDFSIILNNKELIPKNRIVRMIIDD